MCICARARDSVSYLEPKRRERNLRRSAALPEDLFNDAKYNVVASFTKSSGAVGFFTVGSHYDRTHCYLVNEVATFDMKPYEVR